MPAGTKIIQRRIKSVTNTKKITKAMEMVSAAKMRKSTDSVLRTRPYSNLAWQIINKIGKNNTETIHPLLAEKKNKNNKEMVILITSDKGLCGSFNSQMFREVKKFISSTSSSSRTERSEYTGSHNKELDFIILGKKGENFIYREKLKVSATFLNLTNNPKFNDIKPIAKMAMDKFIDGTYNKIFLAYTDYVSILKQNATIRQLLPIIYDEELGNVENNNQSTINNQQSTIEYIFEPEKQELLEMLLPKIVETQIYQAVLESVASEHSARMVAMKNATDAANDMVRDLTLTFNKIRQAGITREISEISAGKAALE